MGIVSSGTCWLGSGAVATSVIVDVYGRFVVVNRAQGSVDSRVGLRATMQSCMRVGVGVVAKGKGGAVQVAPGDSFGTCSRGGLLTGRGYVEEASKR
jgi:hypothetical protein